MLDEIGLASALHWYITRYAKRLNIAVQFEAMHFERRLSPELETTFYRIIQEALTNVAKHAQATRVLIRLECQESIVTVHIEDNGCGFESQHIMAHNNPEQGVGLLGIQERVSLLGGTFQIQSHPGQGAQIAIELPRRDAL
jgi:signal transduction histidine kinase